MPEGPVFTKNAHCLRFLHIICRKMLFSADFNGGLAEQFILQQMKSKQIDPIYYHSTDDSRLELDFLIQSDGCLLPIEVKSGESVRLNSLSMLLQKTPGLRAIRYSLRPYKEQNFLTNIPLYAV